jgi:hypothetical protein
MRNYIAVCALVSFCVGCTSPGVALSILQTKTCFSTTQKGQDGKPLPVCRGVIVNCGVPGSYCNGGKCCGSHDTSNRCTTPVSPCATRP